MENQVARSMPQTSQISQQQAQPPMDPNNADILQQLQNRMMLERSMNPVRFMHVYANIYLFFLVASKSINASTKSTTKSIATITTCSTGTAASTITEWVGSYKSKSTC